MKKSSKAYKGYLFCRNGIWQVEYLAPNADGTPVRIRESLGTGNKKEAIQEAIKRTGPLLDKSRTDHLERALRDRVATHQAKLDRATAERNRIPLVGVWKRFPYNETSRGGTRRPLKPRVAKENERIWESFVRWCGKAKPNVSFMDDFKAADAQDFSNHLKKDQRCGPRSHNVKVDVCRVVFGLAGMKPNPFAGVKKMSQQSEHRDALQVADVQKAVAVATGEIRLLLLIGVFTGLRMGDAVSLRWEDVRDNRIWKRTAKTGREVSLALFPVLADELARLPRPKDGRGPILPGLLSIYNRDASALSKAIRQLFESCGIEVVEKSPGRSRAISRRGFHSLRTTFVSICARAGVPTGAIADWCGHSPEIDRIYQRWAGKETDVRILGALQKMADGLPVTRTIPSPVIELDASEYVDIETMKVEVKRLVEIAKSDVLKEVLALLRHPRGLAQS